MEPLAAELVELQLPAEEVAELGQDLGVDGGLVGVAVGADQLACKRRTKAE